ncbi:MAG: hypothetical protein KY475_23950, partial [Planctomycetes bacterium]|nr:hypothetical protein [Planctomycetota bacterium]
KILREFNNAQTVGGVHGVAVDGERNRIFVRENVAGRLLCFDRHGRKLWQAENVDADVLTVDSKTGHIWCSGGGTLNQGETVVLDANGREVAAHPYRAIDMAYDPHTDCFWLVGYDILKIDRQGKVLFQRPVNGWCCPSVSVNPTNGHVWFIERDHPDLTKSRNRLWKLDANGGVLVERDLQEQDPFAIECDPQTGEAWVATLNSGLLRCSAAGEPMGRADLKAYNLAMSSDGLWVATEEAVLKINKAAEVIVRSPLDRPSDQAWLAVFGTAR